MAYTFGGATSDDITFAAARAIGANAYANLMAGWWYPTTLTATRGYCSAGNTYGMEVDTATDELRFRTDNTTDGQWTTTGADITIDKWWFIAFASSQNNTGPAGAFRCWVGDESKPPAEVTVTNATAPSGNFTANANVYAGNKGTGTLAFQGDVGWLCVFACPTDKNSILGIAANGSISNTEAENVLNRWVIPLWSGEPRLNAGGVHDFSGQFVMAHLPLLNLTPAYQWSHDQATSSTTAVTINGATLSAQSPPRSPHPNWPLMLPRPRRAA